MNHRSKYDVMEEILNGISGLMEDLVQSGFDTVHDGTLFYWVYKLSVSSMSSV